MGMRKGPLHKLVWTSQGFALEVRPRPEMKNFALNKREAKKWSDKVNKPLIYFNGPTFQGVFDFNGDKLRDLIARDGDDGHGPYWLFLVSDLIVQVCHDH